jgi:hypothetical protein
MSNINHLTAADPSKLSKMDHGVPLGRGNLAVADATTHERIQGITGLKPTGPIGEREEYKATIQAFVDAVPAKAPLRRVAPF